MKTIRRVLFVGDSITSHRPITSLGWTTDWGMAATSRENDYVHRFAARISAMQGEEVVPIVHGGGGGTLAGKLADAANLKTQAEAVDLIVVQMGENDKPPTVEGFRNLYSALLGLLVQAAPAVRILCTGVWSPPGGSPVKDAFIREVCALHGATFVDLAPANAHPLACAGRTRHWDHPGVAWHPGDEGMDVYSELLFAALSGNEFVATPASQPIASPGPAKEIFLEEVFSSATCAPISRMLDPVRCVGRRIVIRTIVRGSACRLLLDIHNAEGEHEAFQVESPASTPWREAQLAVQIPDNAVELTLRLDALEHDQGDAIIQSLAAEVISHG